MSGYLLNLAHEYFEVTTAIHMDLFGIHQGVVKTAVTIAILNH